MHHVAQQRRYDICTVIEVVVALVSRLLTHHVFMTQGVHVAGNVSAIKRTADALALQSLHVIGADLSPRSGAHASAIDNRLVDKGSGKWCV